MRNRFLLLFLSLSLSNLALGDDRTLAECLIDLTKLVNSSIRQGTVAPHPFLKPLRKYRRGYRAGHKVKSVNLRPWGVKPTDTVYRLAAGGDGTVYRVVSREKKSELLKVFHDDRNEVHFKAVEALAPFDHPELASETIRIAKFKRVRAQGKDAARYADIEGEGMYTLEELVRPITYGPETIANSPEGRAVVNQIQAVTKIYNDRLTRLAAELDAAGFEAKLGSHSEEEALTLYYKRRNASELFGIISPDSVIVNTTTLEMTFVDPF